MKKTLIIFFDSVVVDVDDLEQGAGALILERVHRGGNADDERILALILLRVRL